MHPINYSVLIARLEMAQLYLLAFILNRVSLDTENRAYWMRQELRADRKIRSIKAELNMVEYFQGPEK